MSNEAQPWREKKPPEHEAAWALITALVGAALDANHKTNQAALNKVYAAEDALHAHLVALATPSTSSPPPEPGAAFEAVEKAKPVAIVATYNEVELTAKVNWVPLLNGKCPFDIGDPLYTHPAPPGIGKELSEAEIEELAKQLTWVGFRQDAEGHYTIPSISPSVLKLIRLVEAHHGIPGARPLVDEGSKL